MQLKPWMPLLVLWIGLAGCGKSETPRSGGRTASYWAQVIQKPDPDVDLRRKAAAKLGPLVLMDPCVFPALETAIKDADQDVRLAAIRSLTIYPGPTKSKEVLQLLNGICQQDGEERVREAAAKSITKLTTPK